MTATTTAFERLLDALQHHGYKLGTRNGTKAQAQCPGHEDRKPSLSITHHGDKTLIFCHGECQNDVERILAPLNLTAEDLFDNPRPTYTYTYPNGSSQRKVHRERGKRFHQDGDKDQFILYGIPRIREFKAQGRKVYLVEGEKDADTINHLSECGTTAPQGANSFAKCDVSELRDVDVVAIRDLPKNDQDASGLKWAEEVQIRVGPIAKSLTFKVAAAGKDVSDHIAAGYTLEELIDDPTRPPDPGRWVNLDNYLDGTYTPPLPSIGGVREDGIQLLYPGMWHTCIGLTTAGKTTFALWQVKELLQWGGHVVYVHFEEANPNGIIHRLRGLGVNTETIRKRFHWGHVHTPWQWGELATQISQLERPPELAILDGINAACGMHGWPVKEPESVGLYRAMFVHPLTQAGAAVLSLGHPPKAVNRQGESYSYGAAGWLNDVDGASYRLTASKTPISKGKSGSSALYSVKDRYGEVERWGELQESEGMPRYYMGQFVVDDTQPEDLADLLPKTVIRMTVPAENAEGGGKDKVDTLGDHIIAHLRETTGKFKTKNALEVALRAKDIHVNRNDLGPALQRLANRGLIEWPEVESGSRPGWLADAALNPEEE